MTPSFLLCASLEQLLPCLLTTSMHFGSTAVQWTKPASLRATSNSPWNRCTLETNYRGKRLILFQKHTKSAVNLAMRALLRAMRDRLKYQSIFAVRHHSLSKTNRHFRNLQRALKNANNTQPLNSSELVKWDNTNQTAHQAQKTAAPSIQTLTSRVTSPKHLASWLTKRNLKPL